MDDLRPPHQLLRPTPTLTNDDIEAVIQMATSSRPSPDGRSAPLKDTRTQLFVGNLPYRVRWQDLKDLFRRAGTVLRADVSLGPDNRSRGYGTVLLATAEDAGRAIDIFNGYSWQTRILEVRPDRLPPDFDANIAPGYASGSGSATSSIPASLSSTPFPDDLDYSALLDHYHNLPNVSGPPCRNLFVGNLPFHCQWQDLKDLFRQAGTIIRADVALGQDGRSRGFGTVVFATEQDAERAVQLFNGFEYNGRPLKVNYDKYMQIGSPNALLPNITGTSLCSRTTSTSPTPSFSSSVQDSRVPTLPHARQIPSHGQSGKLSLPPGYHLDSSASLPIDAWGSQQGMGIQKATQDAEEQEKMLRSLHRLDLESRAPSTHPIPSHLSSITSRAPSASSSIKPPSLATTTSSGSSSSVAASASTSSTSDSSEPPPSQHRRLSSSSRPVTVASLSKSPSLRPGRNRSSQHLSSPHPHHPGPIALPPPPPVTAFPIGHPRNLSPYEIMHVSPLHHPLGSPSSPSYHPHHHQMQYQQQMPNRVPITPHGLPPITPSMPPFNFLPPLPTATNTNTTGPSLSQLPPTMAVNPLMQMGMPMTPMHSTHSHPQSDEQRRYAFSLSSISGNPFGQTSPAASNGNNDNGNHANGYSLGPTPFSPGTMSPGAFWGRPGASSVNPMINPAVGAPVHIHHGGSPTMHHGHMNSPGLHGHVHSPGYPHLHSPVHGGIFYGGGGGGGQGMHEPAGYFDPGYFPPVTHATGNTGAGTSFVENEILKPKDRGGDNMRDGATEERASPEEEENSGERSADEVEEREERSSSKSTSSASDDGDMRVWEGREGSMLEAGRGQVLEQYAAVISRTHSMSGNVPKGLRVSHVHRSGSEPAATHPDAVEGRGKDFKLLVDEVVLEDSETQTLSTQRKLGPEEEAVT